jgi:hypothetical protein
MSIVLTRIEDPRDNLQKATRDELWDYAKANGVDFDQRTTPRQVMEHVLRSKNLVNVRIPIRVLGRPTGAYEDEVAPTKQVEEGPKTVDAMDDLMRQWRERGSQQAEWAAAQAADRKYAEEWPAGTDTPTPRPVLPSEMHMGTLRAELARRGIKFDRKDKKPALLEKLALDKTGWHYEDRS